jgi:hypothetical protein
MRGFWYMIEVVIAGIILIGFLLFVSGVYANIPEQDISIRGYSILHELDHQGVLRGYVNDGNYSGLNSQIILFGYNHSVQICDQGGNCLGNSPDADNVWVGNYMVAGDQNYNPKLVKLYMWRYG